MNAATTTCTLAQHVSTSHIKPVRLLALGDGVQGKTARLEFPDGWQRSIELSCEADAWHPLFSELCSEDRLKLRHGFAHPVVCHPDGRRTRQGELSFISIELNRLGNRASWNHFDVPAQDYSAGVVTGYRCAAELLAAVQRGYGPYLDVQSIIRDAVQAGIGSGSKPNRRGAAAAFMEVMVESVKFMGRHGHNDSWLAGKIDQAEKSRDRLAAYEALRRTEFSTRMKAARQAKRMTPSTEVAGHD